MSDMQNKMDQVRAKVAKCFALAEAKYGIKMPSVQIRFDLTGRAAGMAGYKNSFLSGPSDFYLRFNVQHMALGGKSWDHLLNDTTPHEAAHTVCQAFPKLGKNHDAGWKRVCVALGGNGKRCYSAEDAPEAVAKQRPFQYVSTTGHTVSVSPIIHKKIQFQGAAYRFRNQGSVNKSCSYSLATQVAVKVAAPVAPKVPSPAFTLPLSGKMAIPAYSPTAKFSKAEQLRMYIRTTRADHGSEAYEMAVSYAMDTLGFKAGLARTYTRIAWAKVI